MYQADIEKSLLARYRAIKVLLILVGLLFGVRLFHLQVVRHDFYRSRADNSHLKQFELEAQRGQIFIKDGDNTAPLVLNQTFKKLIADPKFVEKSDEVANLLAEATGKDSAAYKEQLDRDIRYVVLEPALDLETAERVEELNLIGLALRDTTLRIYPDNELAAHVLGFVNAEGEGQYGVEQFFDDQLAGKKGLLSGAFDVRGIPIATSDNIDIEPVDGKDIVLSLDRNIQYKAESIAQKGVKDFKAKSASVVVMDPSNGKIKAMANYPTFNPAEYSAEEDLNIFINKAISGPYEVGSVIKPLTMALGLSSKAVTPSTSYYDSGFVKVGDFTIRNPVTSAAQTRDMTNVLVNSANTGVVFVLRNLTGDKNNIDNQDKQMLYDWFTGKLRFGQKSNIDLAGESPGKVFSPSESSQVRYANMSFGQGMTVSMVQLLSATASVINGGNYYQPTVVDSYVMPDGQVIEKDSVLLSKGVVSDAVSSQIRDMMEAVVETGSGRRAYRSGYDIGGKTGTAQVPSPDGGYYEDRAIGSFIGYGPGDNPKFIAMVRIDEPQQGLSRFAGSGAAAPMFAELSKWLLDYYSVAPTR